MKILKILTFFVSIILFFQMILIQGKAKDSDYKIGNSYVEIQKNSGFQNIPLAKEENGEEKVIGNFKIVDDYLISDIPENEFLEKYFSLRSGFQDLSIDIEADQPIFNKNNFYHSKSLFEKTKSLFFGDALPDYRLTRIISNVPEGLETDFRVPDLNFKTSYNEKEGKIKQNLFLENNSDKEINFQLSFVHSIEADSVSFGGQEYKISDVPQSLSSKLGSLVSFSSSNNLGQHFKYDFSDLLKFNPEVWVFKNGSNNLLLTKIYLSLPPHSSLTIDPSYQVDTVSNVLGTAWGWQRKTWHDGSRYWVSFWSDADNRIEFWYSATALGGSSWTENASARIANVDTNDFCLDCNVVDCFIAYATGSKSVYARSVTLPGGYPGTGFTWGSAIEVASTTQTSLNYVHLARSFLGYLFVTYKETGTLANVLYVKKSTNANNITLWGTAASLDTGSAKIFHGLTVPRSSTSTSRMLAIWADSTTIESKKYDGAAWDLAAVTVDYTKGTTFDENISAIYDDVNLDVHLLYNASDTFDSVLKYKKYDDSAVAWQASVALASSSNTQTADYVSISFDRVSKYLYAFWIGYPGIAPVIYSVKYSTSASTYTAWTAGSTLASSSDSSIWITSNYYPNTDTENDIFAEWMISTTTPQVRFSKIDGAVTNTAPDVVTPILNGGNAITVTENTTVAVVGTTTFIDGEGYANVTSVTSTLYLNNTTTCSSGNANANWCYYISNSTNNCVTSSCSSLQCDVACTANVWFVAEPSTASSSYAAKAWQMDITVRDSGNLTDTASTTQELNVASYLNVDSTIAYGSVTQNSTSSNKTTNATNTGNYDIDVELSGVNMETGGATATIVVGQQKYSSSTIGNWAAQGIALTTSPVSYDLLLPKPTATTSNSTDLVYWVMSIPVSTADGYYTGTNTVSAVWARP